MPDDDLREMSLDRARELAVTAPVEDLIDALCGTCVNGNRLPVRRVVIGRGVLADLQETLTPWLPDAGSWAVVMDRHTAAAAGEDVVQLLPRARAVVLEPLPGWDHVTPHDAMVDLLADRVAADTALVAVGSGTVNDLCKTVAHAQHKRYAAVATAASMNGYTSALAAIVYNGLKSTTPCPPPVAVVADVDVLADAPADMARSGFADMMAKPVSNADWRLGTLVVGGDYNDLPARIVERALDACIDHVHAIDRGRPEALERLMRCLVLSGFSMTLAGSSTPASGGEHLISHYWDMSAYVNNLPPPSLHGLQVAQGVLLSARLYELLWQQDPATFTPAPLDLETLPRVHGPLWQAIRDQAAAQQLTTAAAQARVDHVRAHWQQIRAAVTPLLQPPAAIRQTLASAGVPTTPAAFGLAPDHVRLALLHAADIRNRYSVLHFARDLGLLPRCADDVLAVFDADTG